MSVEPNASEISQRAAQSWAMLASVFDPTRGQAKTQMSNEQLLTGVKHLRDCQMEGIFIEWFFGLWQERLTVVVIPAFWAYMAVAEKKSQNDEDGTALIVQQLDEAIKYIVTQLKPGYSQIVALERLILTSQNSDSPAKTTSAVGVQPAEGYLAKFQRLVRSCVFSVMPRSFESQATVYLQCFLNHVHKSVYELPITAKDAEDEEDQVDAEASTAALTGFQAFCGRLRYLGWTQILEQTCEEVLFAAISKRITLMCKDDFETDCLASVTEWLNHVVWKYVGVFFASHLEEKLENGDNGARRQTVVEKWRWNLSRFAHEQFSELRIAELFSVVVEYPYSRPALENLQVALRHTTLQPTLIKSLKTALSSRLLQPSANTNDIISQYINLIHCMRILDPSGIILAQVADPTRSYLKARNDTVRCIITSLTSADTDGEGGNDLAKELYKDSGDSVAVEFDESDVDNDEGERKAMRWTPDPIAADPSKSSRKGADIISMLVSIYGTKELFVNEYRTLLADRLLLKNSFETDEEVAQLELLKLRFGENSLIDCEVMLRDLLLSKRINASIQSSFAEKKNVAMSDENKQDETQMDVTIISKEFWPQLQTDSFAVLPAVKEKMDAYAKEYAVQKAPRLLDFQPILGQVELDLEFEDRTLTLKVSPVHATIIGHFAEQSEWSLAKLAAVMEVDDVDFLKGRLTFWLGQGVLREVPGASEPTFRLVERLSDEDSSHMTMFHQTTSSSSSTLSNKERVNKENAMLEPYILGVLGSYGKLSLQQIHERMSAFSSTDFAYTKRPKDLHKLLSSLVEAGKILAQDGLYVRA